MEIIISTALILAITFVVRLFNKVAPFRVCPVCAGVSGTWFLLTAAVLRGFIDIADYGTVIALLMGGTVVGIAYQTEKTYAWAKKHGLIWKIAVIGTGIPLAYTFLSNASWGVLAAEAIILLAALYFLFVRPSSKIKSQIRDVQSESAVAEIKRKLEECC